MASLERSPKKRASRVDHTSKRSSGNAARAGVLNGKWVLLSPQRFRTSESH